MGFVLDSGFGGGTFAEGAGPAVELLGAGMLISWTFPKVTADALCGVVIFLGGAMRAGFVCVNTSSLQADLPCWAQETSRSMAKK